MNCITKRSRIPMSWNALRLGIALSSAPLLASAQSQEDADESDEAWLDALLGVEDEELFWEDDAAGELSEPENAEELEQAMKQLTGWDVDTTLSGGMGWKDNVLFSSEGEISSFYAEGVVDFFAMKPGIGKRPELVALAYGETRYYDDVPDFSSEHLVVLHSRASSRFADDWKGTLGFEGTHSKQAFDASVNDFETEAVAVTLWRPELFAGVGRTFERFGSFGLQAGYAQARYSEESEDYDRRAVELEWSRSFTRRSAFEVSWEGYEESYDQRPSRLADGTVASDALLKVRGSRWETAWNYERRDGVFRRARTSFRYQIEDDEEGDYYERGNWQVGESLRWTWENWRLDAGVTYGNLDYEARLASTASPDPRSDRNLRLTTELSREIGDGLEAFLRYELVDRKSNTPVYSYDTQSALIGVSLATGKGD